MGLQPYARYSVKNTKEMYKQMHTAKYDLHVPLVLCSDDLQDDGLHDSSKIAAFDFDGCLAKTAVNRYVYI